ncbi:hypothetical protein ScPMuIL_016087 [Solemya velum]
MDKSIVNHCYWVAASSGTDGCLKKDKWLSNSNHVLDKHDGYHSESFRSCQHGPTYEPRKWLTLGEIVQFKRCPLVDAHLPVVPVAQKFRSWAPGIHPSHVDISTTLQRKQWKSAGLYEDWRSAMESVLAEGKEGCGGCCQTNKVDPTFGYVKLLRQQVVAREMEVPSYRWESVTDFDHHTRWQYLSFVSACSMPYPSDETPVCDKAICPGEK